MPEQTIMLTGGGTAGHITPIIAVVKKIHDLRPGYKFVYVIERNNPNQSLISNSNLPIKVHHIFAGKYRRFHNRSLVSKLLSFRINLLNIRDCFYLLIGTIQSLFLIIRYRPAVLFSKGGYVSMPVTLCAVLLRRRFITHDSDSVSGLANRLMGRFATKNAVGARGADYPYSVDKIVYTGVPVSEEYISRSSINLEEAKTEIGLPTKSQVLFIGGSTQGAKQIDDVVERIAPKLLRKFPKLIVIHSFGRLNEESLSVRYKSTEESLRERLILKSFLPDLYRYLAAADVVVSRAGATALTELGVLGKACVIIPAPQLTAGHQLKNAKFLKDREAAVVLDEQRAGELLESSIEYLLQHPDKRKILSDNIRLATKTDASDQLANLIIAEAIRVKA